MLETIKQNTSYIFVFENKQEFMKTGFKEFHLSTNRKIEYNTCNFL